MEHKLIQGGEQYLPFARSRIKALRATGLRYASQQFEIDGVSIRVRIAGDQEFINITGDPAKILSGVIKGGDLIDIPVPPGSPEGTAPIRTMRGYKPTQNAWEFSLGKNPNKPVSTFNDETRLAKAGDQYGAVSASMYSGLMAKCVAVIMGRGTEVKYMRSWAKCHGVLLDSDNKPWLVEISIDGVLAMRLPVDKGSDKSKTDAEKQAVLLFGGVPSGKAFPVGAKLEAGLLSGEVIRLSGPTEVAPFFANNAFVPYLGWSFSPDGREAHNTCWNTSPTDASQPIGKHYKLVMDISISSGVPSGSAALSMVEEGPLNSLGLDVFLFVSPDGAVTKAPGKIDYAPPTQSGPVFVCHIDGVLEVVRIFTEAYQPGRTVSDNPGGTLPPYSDSIQTTIYGGARVYAKSSKVQTTSQVDTHRPITVASRSTITTESYSFYAPNYPSWVGASWTLSATFHEKFTEIKSFLTYPSPDSALVWSSETRDGYALINGADRAAPRTTYEGYSYDEEEFAAHPGDPDTFYGISTTSISPFSISSPPPGYTDTMENRFNYSFVQIPAAIPSSSIAPDGSTNPGSYVGYPSLDIQPIFGVSYPLLKVFLPDGTEFLRAGDPTTPPYSQLRELRVRASSFGPSKHVAVKAGDYFASTGAMLETESTPQAQPYNFIGYIL